MGEENIRVCMDIAPPETAEEMAVTKKWANGKRLRVHFLGGTSKLHDKIKQYAKQWENYANIKFDFVNDPAAEIRVGFVMNGTSWSALGTDAL
ncbi:MAG TPA: hypothetical protein VFH31_04110, partial [Pyrinomonadaceae bacterium]|nr:hypothetical protein [Pyrinomonadaceae bacterium]